MNATADNTPMSIVVVRERPILFSGEMVRAILDGRKSQTRRVFAVRRELLSSLDHDLLRFDRWQDGYPDGVPRAVFDYDSEPNFMGIPCPYGNVGDRLWVRETFYDHGDMDGLPPLGLKERVEYRATEWDRFGSDPDAGPWSPSIHMPRWASRITLEITEVRVERIEDISEDDAIAEGCFDEKEHDGELPSRIYRELWDSLNEKRGYGWDANPWVWVLSFGVVSPLSERASPSEGQP